MLYDALANLVETHVPQLAREIAQLGIDSNLPAYAGLDVDTLAKMVEPTVATVGRYVRTGNPDEFREYTVKIIERRMSEGRDIADVLTLSYYMFDSIKALVEREFSGVENISERERYIRRLNSMRTFSTITVNATRLQNRRPQQQ